MICSELNAAIALAKGHRETFPGIAERHRYVQQYVQESGDGSVIGRAGAPAEFTSVGAPLDSWL